MKYTLQCACGAQTTVGEGSAGATFPCDCGRTLVVPSLHELPKSGGVIHSAGQPAPSEARPWGDGDRAAQADVEYAVDLLNGGASPEEVQGKLAERGLDQADAAAIVRDLLIQAIYADAAAMLNSGVSPRQAQRRLVDRGLKPQAAKAIIDDLLAHAQSQAREAGCGGLALQLLGGLVFLAGVGLFFGNITGVFPTLPFAGFVVMGIGGAIFGAGQRAG